MADLWYFFTNEVLFNFIEIRTYSNVIVTSNSLTYEYTN